MANTARKVARDYLARRLPDFWLTQLEVAALCPGCARKMASLNIRQVRASVIFGDAVASHSARTAEKWKSLPEGWTTESLREFWKSLTGGAKHKVTQCIKKMDGKVGDPGAFCAAARDRIEGTTDWRSER